MCACVRVGFDKKLLLLLLIFLFFSFLLLLLLLLLQLHHSRKCDKGKLTETPKFFLEKA